MAAEVLAAPPRQCLAAEARLRVVIRGAVQGVGFRPFVYRLATELGLAGWVNNSAQGVFIEAEGSRAALTNFLLRIEKEKPPRASIQGLEPTFLDVVGYRAFEIRASEASGAKTALVLPDIATCGDCLREIFAPHNRRHRYPFTNCTHCGPRFSIIEALPYDRANTTMKDFEMCNACRAEYENPRDRRFHAQPNACPQCGPHLELWNPRGKPLAARDNALRHAAEAIRAGAIVAVKGLGGFHLVVDARNEEAVRRLRRLKHREEKPFALMYPSLERIERDCKVSALESRLLRSPESPIVLLQRHGDNVAASIAPGNPYLGVMLPYTPLHHLLLGELGFPIVATSGNLAEEPICTDEREALERLGGIAKLFLVHNRRIARHVDDSVARILLGRELVLRRARGYAPLPVFVKEESRSILAVGGHLKNSVAISAGRNVFISQHIGDLETAQAFDAFQRVIADFERLYEVHPDTVACDLHPDYLSTRFAQNAGLPVAPVQHHLAHVLACMAENELEGPVLGIAWDGTGYGPDGTVWGGEFLRVNGSSWERAAHLRRFPLPGGEAAVKEPRRTAVGLLYELFGDAVFGRRELAPVRSFSTRELSLLQTMLRRNLNAPLTSSAGRLFDAVAAILGMRQQSKFEGQAAMDLEFATHGLESDAQYPYELDGEVADWSPIIHGILDDLEQQISLGEIAARFHNTLAEMIVAVAGRVGQEQVVLSGGCFQNRYLTERAVMRLRAEGFRPYWHQRVPPNDGGIALGQLIATLKQNERGANDVSGHSRKN